MVNGFDLPQSPVAKPFFKADPLPGEKGDAPSVASLKGDAYQAARQVSRRHQEMDAQAERGAAAYKARPLARNAAIGRVERTLLAKKGISKEYVPKQASPAPTIRAGYTPGPVQRHDVELTGPAAQLAQKHANEGITSADSRVKEFSARYPSVTGKYKQEASAAHADLINKHLSVMPAGSGLHENHVKNHEHEIWNGAAKAQQAGDFEKKRQAKADARPGLQVASADHVATLFSTVAQQNPTMHPEVVGEHVNNKLSEDLNLQHAQAKQAFPSDTHMHADARKSLLLSRTSVRNAHRDMVSGHVEKLKNEVFDAANTGKSHPRYESMVKAAIGSKITTESGEDVKAPEGKDYFRQSAPASPTSMGPGPKAVKAPKGPAPTAEKIAKKKEISPARSAAVESFVKAPLTYHFGQGAAK